MDGRFAADLAPHVARQVASDPEAQRVGMQMAGSAVTSAVQEIDWEQKRDQAFDTVLEVGERLRRGDVSTQALCFAGGCAMLLYSLLCLINVFSVLDSVFQWVFNVYVLFFSVVIIAYECPVTQGDTRWLWVVHCFRVQQVRAWFDEWFKAFSMLAGRGALYFAIGNLLTLGNGVLSALGIMGVYMMGCGGFLLFRSFTMRRSLEDAKGRLQQGFAENHRVLRPRFAQYDRDGRGLDQRGLGDLFHSLTGTQLSAEESHATVQMLSASGSQRVQFDEFVAWYTNIMIQREQQMPLGASSPHSPPYSPSAMYGTHGFTQPAGQRQAPAADAGFGGFRESWDFQ